MARIADRFPDFSLPSISSDHPDSRVTTLSSYAGVWLLVVFYPRDFSFVCPTELLSFSGRIADFERRNCHVLGVSIDSIDSHREWLATPVTEGGLGPLRYPLATDQQGGLARELGIWLPREDLPARGLFIVDPEGILQYSVIHNLSVGRNVDEILRVVDAMQSGGLCPANWTASDGTIDLERAIQPGRVIGHYRIRRLLGEGAAGSVFAAWDLRLERDVALKVLKRLTLDSHEATLREARTVSPLTHPNVCGIYAVDELDGLSVIVMEYVEGRPLHEFAGDRLPIKERLSIARGIAAGLSAAHKAHIVHGDLKPANVLVTGELEPKILDFGLARRASRRLAGLSGRPGQSELTELPGVVGQGGAVAVPQPVLTAAIDLEATLIGTLDAAEKDWPSSISGTPAYMAPEQWTGRTATAASDVFAFGLILFELTTGHRALRSEHVAGLLQQVRDPHLAETLARELPLRLRQILIATLTTDPEQRPTAAQVVDMLDA